MHFLKGLLSLIFVLLLFVVPIFVGLLLRPYQSAPVDDPTDDAQEQLKQGYLDVVDSLKGNIYTMCSDPDLQKTSCQQALNSCSQNSDCFQMVQTYHNNHDANSEITYSDYFNASLEYVNMQRAALGLPALSQ